MRRRTVITVLFCGLCLLDAGCTAAERTSTESAGTVKPEERAAAAGAQGQVAQGEPPAGDVQERAVPRMMPGQRILPAPGPAPQPMVPGAPVALSCLGAGGILPGEYAIGTWRGTYLTAVGGGGRITQPVVRTDAQKAGPWEKYKLFVLPSSDPHGQYFIQTASQNCITAVGGGGQTTDVLHTDATKAQAWEFFRFYFDPSTGYHAIQTVSTKYLTALGGGYHADPPAVHTDAATVNNWEKFHLWKCGDLGSNWQYAIWVPYNGTLLQAMGGGGRVLDALHAYEAPQSNWGKFTLIRQSDGSYAIQTANGNFITAIRGGGLAHGEPTWDNLVTDRTQAQAWEKFKFIDQGDCSYVIQTLSGFYLGMTNSPTSSPRAQFSTDISDINSALRFRMIAAFVE
jgi:hypothetical protein